MSTASSGTRVRHDAFGVGVVIVASSLAYRFALVRFGQAFVTCHVSTLEVFP